MQERDSEGVRLGRRSTALFIVLVLYLVCLFVTWRHTGAETGQKQKIYRSTVHDHS